jgi:PAS domain S-box-containing protein
MQEIASPDPRKRHKAARGAYADDKCAVEKSQDYGRLFEHSVLGIFQTTLDGKIIDVNPAYARMFGYESPEEIKSQVGNVAHDLYADPSRRNEFIRKILETRGSVHTENRHRRKDGSSFICNLHAWAVYDADGKEQYLEGFVEDITERKHAEEEKERLAVQLRQAQKLEAIGTLAGGIAHNLNNILVPIIGYAEMALKDLAESSPLKFGQEQILSAALRARDLVNQVMVFGRSGKDKQQGPVEIGSIINEALRLLKAWLPSSIEIVSNIENGVASVDATQIHELLVNLCSNAAHAMGEKGVLGVKSSFIDLSEADIGDLALVDIEPGPYLRLIVSDTGSGMNEATLKRIFEPYFTTKEVGKGTGLGLAVVHGIVKRHQGAISVQSEPGRGAAFDIYIPAVEGSAEMVGETKAVLPAGTERILLIDDERSVIETGTAILEQLGYKVTSETSGLRGLEAFRSASNQFDLVITDYTMPNLTGVELVRKVREIRPDMPIILCTGFGDNFIREAATDLRLEFILKPFCILEFIGLVRTTLDRQQDLFATHLRPT